MLNFTAEEQVCKVIAREMKKVIAYIEVEKASYIEME